MKANRKFLNGDDEAVSPVIAVILMVAITVVLAATVYVWVSGFGAQSGNPQKSISLTSAGALSGGFKTYAIASGTSGMKYSDITVTLNGATFALDATAVCANPQLIPTASQYLACTGTTRHVAADVISAGDVISLRAASGDTLRILDAQANAVILTLTVG
jgi:flagellin-like protein